MNKFASSEGDALSNAEAAKATAGLLAVCAARDDKQVSTR